MQNPEILLEKFFESCGFKSVASGVVGFGAGGVFGLIMSGVDYGAPTEEGGAKLKFKQALRQAGAKSFSYAKGFGLVGAMFAGSECLVEKYRAKHDLYNGLSAGCITGGALGARAGPQAAVVGCAGFAAFSGAIEYLLTPKH